MIRIFGRLAMKLNLGASPKDAASNVGGGLISLGGLLGVLLSVGWLPKDYQPLVLVLPAVGGVLVGSPIGKDQNLNSPERRSNDGSLG